MNPRPYQSHVIAAVERGWAQFRKQLIVVPTGGGKTIIFSILAARTMPERTLILAHREELIDQAIDKLHKATGIYAEKEKAEHAASTSADVVVASVQTMIRRLDKWPSNHFGLIVCDEAHHSISESWQTVLRWFPNSRVLGVTATPDRGDKRNLGEYYESIAAEVPLFTRPDNPIEGLVNSGYLSPIAIKSIPLSIDLSSVSMTKGDLDSTELGHTLEPYLPQIAAAIREHASFRRTLCFLPLIATSLKFVEACEAAGLRAEHIDGNSEDRQQKLARFARWDFDVLSNAMLLTEGYDDPGIDCICVLRPTRSRGLYSQMVGRGTRVEATKENLLLLDFLWNHERFQLAKPANLIAKTEEEAEQISKLIEEQPATGADQLALDLQGLESEATAKREAALAKRLAEQKHKAGKYISAEEFALTHHALAVAEYEPEMKWERDPATEKQLKYLKRAGIDPETVTGKGHASKLLDLYFGSKKLELASAAQRQLMRRMGHPSPDTSTEEEARKFFATLKRKAT